MFAVAILTITLQAAGFSLALMFGVSRFKRWFEHSLIEPLIKPLQLSVNNIEKDVRETNGTVRSQQEKIARLEGALFGANRVAIWEQQASGEGTSK